MMDKRVTISILMPMRNAEAYIVETIQSLLDQTFSDFELIIIDDGSSDASLSMVKSFIDGRIRILKGNMQGISAALNRGLKSAQGKFVCRCDSDDIYPKERLQSQIRWFEGHGDFIAVAGKFSSMDEKSKVIAEFKSGESECDITSELLTGKTRTHLGTYLVRKNVLDDLGGYREYFVTAEDIDMQLRLAEKGLIGYIPENMYFYRIHNDSITHVQSSNKREFYEGIARDFLKQRLKVGQDDLQRGEAPAPPAVDNKPKDSSIQILGYLIGESWRLHGEKKKHAALLVAIRACTKKPFYWQAWKNIIMILIKK